MRTAPTLMLLAASLLTGATHAARFETLAQFTGQADGGMPFATLKPLHGKLYGETSSGGANGGGTIFAADPNTGTLTGMANFAARPLGETPSPAMAESGGRLYGTSYFGGQSGLGFVFAFDPATRALTTVYSFNGNHDGMAPETNVIAKSGTLYGTTAEGGASRSLDGALFAVTIATGAETILHSFGIRKNDGGPPHGLIWHGGALYGTTGQGGRFNGGTIFTVDPTTGREKLLYQFASGSFPESSLIFQGGLFYGTTAFGGPDGAGTLFSFDPKTRTETLLHSFTGGGDGAYPLGGLVALDGKFYGTAATGGTGPCSLTERTGCGTVFRFDPATGTFKVLYEFGGGADGGTPYAGLAALGSRLYGTTMTAGNAGCNGQGCGTLFRVRP